MTNDEREMLLEMEAVLELVQERVAAERARCLACAHKSRPTPREMSPRHWESYKEAWTLREMVANEIAERIEKGEQP